ncbi:alkanesulfonate monooxygenase SsuD/methylene tetrahydromethanopterin reductase-like flavin-dependent oxidoreductase (luciferase family) [Kribbella sp. VKM Ac-2527]|uniref:Alkanesulfonate monooxygenase SsuD/methylene tetrahydromethanopterin reductase-like flavin-dependent oxidoreductase (Luciferase family) n=1 Tax=Kribbella caucasensis TaxID=2512215 RepID=A0A4R6KIC0_9ACTN|nr:LLM class flavin-dependent oxidoreductase [Kribbella sp. VKM Ac-2527]TDO49420.1 alkanesulfonate monooxygenase SsuD/methylene tetrahydromethanopterin reductase-like flavin-dependent oxidoreductase (luciferase family) [Kribbella sp. VKM Ac-2527]
MNVRFGYGSRADVRAVADVVRLAEQADRQDLDHFSTSDHPYLADQLDAYAMVGYLLGRTERIAGLANVSNLPLRPAPMLARTASSLASLSGGRVILGLGAGGLPERIAAMGGPRRSPTEAVEAFEEGMVLLKALTTAGPPVTSEGPHYPVDSLPPAPAPGLQIWTGSVGKKSLAATGRRADGWIPGHAADWLSDAYKESRAIIDQAAAEVGRKPSDIATIYNLPGVITARPVDRVRDAAGRWLGGSADQWIEELTGAVLEHGASGFTLFPRGTEPFELSLKRWARDIVPAVRAAIS